MKRTLASIALILFSINAIAQSFLAPNYEDIKKKTKDPNSVYYYPTLLRRYKANDTTLQKDEYKYLYYGYNYNKDTSMVDESVTKRMDTLMRQDSLNLGEKKEAIKLARLIIDKEPFELKKINLLHNVYYDLGDTITSELYLYKLRGIIRTILSSGNGKTQQTAYHVIDVSDEYVILSVFGYRSAGQTLLYDPPCDKLKLMPNKDNVEYMFFDATQIFQAYEDLFKNVDLTIPEDTKKPKSKKR